MNKKSVENIVLEIKDKSELMVDLAYSSLLYDNKTIAKEVYADVNPDELTDETISEMLGMAGVEGTSLPERMAEINEILNALPVKLRERLLIEYLNDLFRYQ